MMHTGRKAANDWITLLGIALLTAFSIWIAFQVGFARNDVITIWPAAGVLYWAAHVQGLRGTLVAAVTGVAYSFISIDNIPPAMHFIPVSNAFAALIAVTIERRMSTQGAGILSAKGFPYFVIVGVGGMALLATIFGNAIIYGSMALPLDTLARDFWVWFLADYTGAIFIAPLLMESSVEKFKRLKGLQVLEDVLAVLVTVFVIWILFKIDFGGTYGPFAAYLCAIPFVLLIANKGHDLRLCISLTTFAAVILGLTGVWWGEQVDQALAAAQVYMAVAVLAGYYLHAISVDRGVAYQRLKEANMQLENVNEEVTRRADHDFLTGMYSLHKFMELTRLALVQKNREKRHVALAFIDLDGFKKINDQWGHDAGDNVLKVVAARIFSVIRETDYICRTGGDEFAVLFNAEHACDWEEVGARVLKAIKEPCFWHEEQLFVGASLGLTLAQDNEMELDILLKRADELMYAVKRRGKNGINFDGEFITSA